MLKSASFGVQQSHHSENTTPAFYDKARHLQNSAGAAASQLIFRKPLREIDTPEQVEAFLDDVLPLQPDALLLGNPATIGFRLKQLRRRGLSVPANLSIVGMDDWPTAEAFTPKSPQSATTAMPWRSAPSKSSHATRSLNSRS
ncbi:MAG: substrate-binding domain-containing protein [Lentisphaeria bacterium]|nr:substrate-binding domain-containing protein [Lentisphaeria bacterium]